jgi:hypothetical protein
MQEPLGLEEQDQFDREMRPKDKHWDDLNLKGQAVAQKVRDLFDQKR